MKLKLAALLVSFLAVNSSPAHESVGHAGFKNPGVIAVETEFYAGGGGYLHGGAGVVMPLGERQRLGIVGHFVQEESGADIFPSLGAEVLQGFDGGFELETFAFGYFPVERQHAWAVGVRGRKMFPVNPSMTVSPFFGPAYARVRAIEEESDSPVSIGHLMLLGGIAMEAGPVSLALFASHSFFSRDPFGLETHVDLEEMTHLAAYENNDGFARNTAGAELSYSPMGWLTLTARYALINYEDGTRHTVTFTPSVRLTENVEVFAGVQLLRGNGEDNNLLTTGVAVSF